MSVELDLAGGRGMRASAVLEERNRDRRFFTGMAIAAALTVFVGFAPTYYLRGLSEARPLSPLVHLHGIVSTAWILLFLTQTSLVAARRTDLHRRLGIAGVVLAVSVLVIGFVTAVTAARNGVTRLAGLRRSRSFPSRSGLFLPSGSWRPPASTIGAGAKHTDDSCYWRRSRFLLRRSPG